MAGDGSQAFVVCVHVIDVMMSCRIMLLAGPHRPAVRRGCLGGANNNQGTGGHGAVSA